MLTISKAALAAMSLLAVPLAAQDACDGPGSAFGVVSYQCGDCTMTQKPGATPTWQFRTEPLVVRTTDGSVLRSGDIVEAVNDAPITTTAGAALFVRPASGTVRITVRRDGHRTTLETRVDCGPGGKALPETRTVSDTAPPPAKQHGRFGFAIACSNCTRQVGQDGIGYWTFTSAPVIGDIDPDGPAARVGLRSGDVIVAVDGHPVLERPGANALALSIHARTLRLTVQRDGRAKMTVDITARPGSEE